MIFFPVWIHSSVKKPVEKLSPNPQGSYCNPDSNSEVSVSSDVEIRTSKGKSHGDFESDDDTPTSERESVSHLSKMLKEKVRGLYDTVVCLA